LIWLDKAFLDKFVVGVNDASEDGFQLIQGEGCVGPNEVGERGVCFLDMHIIPETAGRLDDLSQLYL
tara:strand:+ start:3197 stop:3397 length:201 start_codon:yes stop_codon:yes gene_type:complete